MAAPAINSISFDKSFYTTGQTVTMTIHYTIGGSYGPVHITVNGTDEVTGESTGPVTDYPNTSIPLVFNVSPAPAGTTPQPDPVQWTVSDTSSDTWNLVSDSGSVAVFTTTAP